MKYLKLLVGIFLLVPVAIVKIVFVGLGLIVVPFAMSPWTIHGWAGTLPKAFLIAPNRPYTIWEAAVRNPVGGLDHLITPPATYDQWGEVKEPTVTRKSFQWRIRFSGVLVSFRMLWRDSDTKYGEMYLGWKLGSVPGTLDFALSVPPLCRWYATVGQ